MTIKDRKCQYFKYKISLLFFSNFRESFMLFAEYLITIFPNHDLRECGRDWRACISYVNSLIRYLCSAAKRNPVSYFSSKYGHYGTNAF